MTSHIQHPAMPPKYADHNTQPAIESIMIRASVVMSHPQRDRVDLPVDGVVAEFNNDLFQRIFERASDDVGNVADMD